MRLFALTLLVAAPVLANASSEATGTAKATDGAPAVKVIDQLSRKFAITLGADSWQHLLDRAQPTFIWNGCDMIWITEQSGGHPQFALEEAYLLKAKDQPERWILPALRSGPIPDITDADFGLEGERDVRPLVLAVSNKIPHQDDPGEYDGGGYAVVKSSHPDIGTVYEICWDKEMGRGNAHPEYHRLLYVAKDTVGRWHFLGEGPEEGSIGGWECESTAIEAKVEWTKARYPSLPLEIHFVRSESTSFCAEAEDVFFPDLTTREDLVLSGVFPATLQTVSPRPYLIADKGDTLNKIVRRLGAWRPTAEANPSPAVLQMWQTELRRLNPGLPQGAIAPGTRVQVLTRDEVYARAGKLTASAGQ